MDRDPTPLCDATPNEAKADWLACKMHKHLGVNAFDTTMIANFTKIEEVTGTMAVERMGCGTRTHMGQKVAHSQLQK